MARPKSGKAKEVLNCRVPHGLVARISAYADLHSQKVQEVVAEALLKHLEEDHVAPLETDAALVVRQAQQRFTEGMKLINSVLTPHRASSRSLVASMNAESTASQTLAEDKTWAEIPPYDRAKYHLDSLCKRGHAWGNTGQSLRNADNQCLECRALAKREKDARKRAEREVQAVSG